MTVFLGQFNKGWLSFGGNFNESRLRDFAKKNENMSFRLEPDTRPNVELIRFFEGAIVPSFFYQHAAGTFDTFKDARECLKYEFNATYGKDLQGRRIKQGGSLAEVYKSKMKTRAFIDKIQNYFLQNGYEFPDSEDYKRWTDSAPAPDEVYPPIARLIKLYKEIMNQKAPWRALTPVRK